MSQHAADPGQRVAQRLLADDMTARIHGTETTRRVIEASRILFGGGDLRAADAETLGIVAGEVKVLVVSAAQIAAGFPLMEALIGSGLAASKGEARRGLEGNGFSINGEKVSSERPLRIADVIAKRFIVLQKGKRNYALIEVH
jgi:tyrosyl-tRNA synthetase